MSKKYSIIANKFYIDATTAFLEATDVKAKAIQSALDISNFVGTAFLNSTDCPAKVPSSLNMANMINNMIHIHLYCSMDASLMDKRVNQELLNFQFCLSLRQSSYEFSTKVVTEIYTLSKITVTLTRRPPLLSNVSTNISTAFGSTKETLTSTLTTPTTTVPSM